MSPTSRLAAALVAGLLALALTAAAAHAAVLVPTKTADSADGACDEDCSLREAVIAANERPGADVILLAAGIYNLTLPGNEDGALSGDLDLLDDLVIVGSGAGDTVLDGGNLDRIFEVPGGVEVELRDLTLRNGRVAGPGGAIANRGELTLRRSVVHGNASVAGGGQGPGGGGIYSVAAGSRLVVADSTLAGNQSSGNGGGIAASEQLQVTNVTVTGNSASGSGGGLYLFSQTTANINNATIADNGANGVGGGIFADVTPFVDTAPDLRNSVVADNVSGGGHPDCAGAFDSAFNLIGNSSGCNGPSPANQDKVGSPASPLDPRLEPLLEGGGPTQTRALASGSPAIDAGSPDTPGSGGSSCAASDQRGASRPGGSRCDIGAFERTAQCVNGGSVLCLEDERFQATASFQVSGGQPSVAQARRLTRDSGYYWFFAPDNVEVTVKLIDGCALNGHYWVFASGMTNVKVDLTVVDTSNPLGTGGVKRYTNPQGQTFSTILDTRAFARCP